MITDEMVQEACDIYSGVYVDDDKDMGDAMRAVLSHFHDRIEALEAELKLTKEQRNEGGEMILKLVARIEQLEAALRSIADKCPATCDMTLAHEMAQEAEAALAPEQSSPPKAST